MKRYRIDKRVRGFVATCHTGAGEPETVGVFASKGDAYAAVAKHKGVKVADKAPELKSRPLPDWHDDRATFRARCARERLLAFAARRDAPPPAKAPDLPLESLPIGAFLARVTEPLAFGTPWEFFEVRRSDVVRRTAS